eukprot:5119670-Pleurochrysis_carterae.AAC.1
MRPAPPAPEAPAHTAAEVCEYMSSECSGNLTKVSILDACFPIAECLKRFRWKQSTFGSRCIDSCFDETCGELHLEHQHRSPEPSRSFLVNECRQLSSDSGGGECGGTFDADAARAMSSEMSLNSSYFVETPPQLAQVTSERKTPLKTDLS